MTYLEKYELIEEKIVKAIPDIRSIKFGCKAFYKGKILTNLANNGRFTDTKIFANADEEDLIMSGATILVRDITLEDVLVALNKVGFDKNMLLAGGGTINYDCQKRAKRIMLVEKWWPNKPLRKQSEDLINFLYEVL